MLPIVQRWLAILGVGAALFGFGMFKGCQHEQLKRAADDAKAEVVAIRVTQTIKDAQAPILGIAKSEHAKTVALARDLAADNGRLRDNLRRLSDALPVACGSAPSQINALLGQCAEQVAGMAAEGRYAVTAGRAAEGYYDAAEVNINRHSTLRKQVNALRKGTP